MNDPSGSQWRQWDLHFHTPSSYDYLNASVTNQDIVDALIGAGVSVVAITDHHRMDVPRIQELQKLGRDKLVVLPGIEFRSDQGGDPIHFICLFPETCDISHVWTRLEGSLGLTAQSLKEKGGDDKVHVSIKDTATLARELGGLVTIHAGEKSNSIESIRNREQFQQRIKYDITNTHVDVMEIGQLKDIDVHLHTIFKFTGLNKPLVLCSDNHNAKAYSRKAPTWIKADPTFAGLRMAIRQPQSRFYIGPTPPSDEAVGKNKTRYIKSISFVTKPAMPAEDKWLQGHVPLNPGLVAVIGNKGSGKSALADCLGLLGACGTSGSFSFLEPNRFCNPKTGRAQYVDGTLHWHDGAPRTRVLNETVGPDEPERVKYLPQNFVEKVCNDLASPGGGEFERELKKVVFSKVPKPDQLEKRSLDELVQYRTQEIRREADSLAASLVELAEDRAALEDRLDPTVESALKKRIAQIQEQIKSHEATKPVEVKPPAEDPTAAAQTRASMEALEKLRKDKEETAASIKDKEGEVSAQQLRAAQAEKLLDKIKNLETEFERRKADLAADANGLGLDAEALVYLKVDRPPIESVRNAALKARDAAKKLLDDPLPDGLRAKSRQLDVHIKAAQFQMDRPNQEYQAYLEKLAAWQETLTKLNGSADDPSSLVGLQADLTALNRVPAEIAQVTAKLEGIAAEIHKQRVAEANVNRELYQPVQQFVDEHALAKEQLRIEFRVDLVEEGFVETLVSHINQQPRGSFSGVIEGRDMARRLAAPTDWAEWAAVEKFLRDVVDHLHNDRRPGPRDAVLLKNQIGKGRTVSELYAWLYGLGYVKPRYILKSDGKGLEQLSPGERGTLLLVFYLLVDDSDLPLIIDQPEANLDNLTVADKLVACIRDARERRQVIIVTHNPNLAVVCDADQIIHASMDIADGHRITYKTGALENPAMNEFTIKVLEGGRKPFDMRDDTYAVCGQ
ncbi:MAG: TrlF family AAA-like ATPase [Phycisphaerales bacterium]